MKLQMRCHGCGLVEVAVAALELLAEREGAEPQAYGFRCPRCLESASSWADGKLLGALTYLGVGVRVAPTWRLGPEDAAVAALRHELDDPDVMARLLGGPS